MVTKLYPIGNYVYDSAKRELDSPDGCALERDGQIYSDAREKYSDVVRFNGEFNHYFVPANEVFSGPGNLEKKVYSELTNSRKTNFEKAKLKKTISIVYFTEIGVGVGIILAELFSGR